MIKFNELSVKNQPVQFTLMLLAAAFLVLSLFDVFTFLDEKTVKYLTAFFGLYSVVHNLKPFYFRNYVQWNKRGITIRVNSFWGYNFSFSNVREIVYADNAYTVYTYGNKTKVINLEGIDGESKSRLRGILREYTR